MFTQCPRCKTYFRVRSEHLRAAHGQVRCSLCEETFNALHYLLEELPPNVEEAAPAVPEEAELRPAAIRDLFADIPEAGEASGEEAEPTVPLDEFSGSEDDDASTRELPESPDFLTEAHPPAKGGWRTAGWSLAALLMLVLLAAQIVNSHRQQLRHLPQFGSLLTAAYRQAGHPLPPFRRLAEFSVTQSSMTTDPDQPGALLLSGIIRNTARWTQPAPDLLVALEDRWGRTVASRYFAPSEYLRDEDTDNVPMAPARNFSID
ncbi:MAG: zinc-ribbon and DUF3426 domain-containing protein, partial [Gammaproteobacteria bacterium]